MKISDIIYPNEYTFTEVDMSEEFDSISVSVDDIKNGTLLIIPNSSKIPTNYSFKQYPIAAICDSLANLPKDIPKICVENPRRAMANAFYRYEGADLGGMKIIGITGTNGKSSTAMFIEKILSECGYRTGLIGTGKISINGEAISPPCYSMTTPDPPLLYSALRQMKDSCCDVVIMEVSSHALALDKASPIFFDYGIFTNLSQEHLDFHRNTSEYFKAKIKLFERCKCSVFNIDDEYGRLAYELCNGRKISAGIIWHGDVWASNIKNRGIDGIGLMYYSSGFSFNLNLKLSGIYNAYNAMLAATVCIDIGCKPCKVKEILSGIEEIPGRFEIIKDEITVIIDYAHTSTAFESILGEIAAIKGESGLTVVFGCGGERDKLKRPKMAKIAEKFANNIIITNDNPRKENPKEILADIIRGFENGCFEVVEDRIQAITKAILNARHGEIVAIIGKGPEKYNIDKDGYHDFDEGALVKSILEKRKEKAADAH